jgi:hypothetical protein
VVTLKSNIFWDLTLCSVVEVHRNFWGTNFLHHEGLLTACFTLVFCLAYSLTLKMGAVHSFQNVSGLLPENMAVHSRR